MTITTYSTICERFDAHFSKSYETGLMRFVLTDMLPRPGRLCATNRKGASDTN